MLIGKIMGSKLGTSKLIIKEKEYDHIEYTNIENYSSKIFNLKYLQFNKSIGDQVFIPGNTFLFTASHWDYAHLMQDCIGHYEFLKKYIPNLNFVPIYNGNLLKDLSEGQVSFRKVEKDLYDHYGIKIKNVIDCNKSIKFENVFYLYNEFIQQIQDLPSNPRLHGQDSTLDYPIHQFECATLINKEFGKYKTKDQPQKIYISRTKINWKHEKDLERSNTRVLDNEKVIEDYFHSLGYQIIFNEDLGLKDQISIYSSAKKIVTVNGTGAYNCIFSEDAEIFLIDVSTNWDWFFDLMINHVTNNTIVYFPDKELKNSLGNLGRIPHDIIIKSLKENEDLF